MMASREIRIALGTILCLAGGATHAQQPESRLPATASRLDVLAYIKNSAYRKHWRLFPGTKPYYNGQEPHGTLLTTYVNDAALSGLLRKVDTMPYGSMIITENYMPDKALASLTVMYKVKGYNPRAGDWYWLKERSDATVEGSGEMDSCIACHKKSERDYIMRKLP